MPLPGKEYWSIIRLVALLKGAYSGFRIWPGLDRTPHSKVQVIWWCVHKCTLPESGVLKGNVNVKATLPKQVGGLLLTISSSEVLHRCRSRKAGMLVVVGVSKVIKTGIVEASTSTCTETASCALLSTASHPLFSIIRDVSANIFNKLHTIYLFVLTVSWALHTCYQVKLFSIRQCNIDKGLELRCFPSVGTCLVSEWSIEAGR